MHPSAAWWLLTPDPVEELEPLLSGRLDTGDWLRAGAIFVGSIIVAIVVTRAIRLALERGLDRTSTSGGFAALLVSRLIGYVIATVGFVYALSTLGVRVAPLLGALGIGGLVLALALQRVVENFFGSLLIQSRRPFTVGDTVRIDDAVGVIVDVDARTTVLDDLDGTTIRIPNANVLNTNIVNLTQREVRRSSVIVGVAYHTDLAEATGVLSGAVAGLAEVASNPAPLVVLRRFGESSIEFEVFYWHRSSIPAELRTTHAVVLAVHRALADAGITIAFPQLVVWPPPRIDGEASGPDGS